MSFRKQEPPARPSPKRPYPSHSALPTVVNDVILCIYNIDAVFEWDANNLRKIRAHRIKRAEVEEVLSNAPILIYEQNVGGEPRFVYYRESDAGRLIAVVLTERADRIRVVTAYKLDAGQKRDYLARRLRGE